MGQPPLPPTFPGAPGAPRQPQSEWQKFIAGFGYAFNGLGYALRTQRNVRVHIAIGALAVFMVILFHTSAIQFSMIFVAIPAPLVADMLTKDIELFIDLSTPD